MRVLVTGATGFVGAALVNELMDAGRFAVQVVIRREAGSLPLKVEHVVVGDLTPVTVWQSALAGVSVVVHLVARMHVRCNSAIDALAQLRYVNVESTLNLARQAATAGVRRFVFLSTVKVHGEEGDCKEVNFPAPENAYGISKYEAELGLRQIAAETNMEMVIIRPPLVYGPGVKGRFHALLWAVAHDVPLPLGAIHNRRSLVALDNLLDLIITCLDHPAAANQTFLVSDGEDISTPDLVRRLACALSCQARLISVPTAVLMASATLLGKREIASRLCGSLRVDITKARKMLGWTPPVSIDEGLRRTAEHYLQQWR